MTELNGSEIVSNLIDELERFTEMTEQEDDMLKDELRSDISADLDRYYEISDSIQEVTEDMEIRLSINDGHSLETNTGSTFISLIADCADRISEIMIAEANGNEHNVNIDELMTDVSDCIRTYPEYKDSLDAVLKETSPEQHKENADYER